MSGEPRNLLTEWARLVAGALASAGVRRVVVSPGSRSTPYLVALAERDDLTLVSVLDERSASFAALGMARATGAPVALLTTSGTAPGHALPAVMEAAHAAVPLLILSADRPVEMRGSGAPQTADQVRLFGDYARAFVDLGDPSAHPEALRHARRAVLEAVAASLGTRPGPVHINLPARKPLEPRAAESDAERALRDAVDGLSRGEGGRRGPPRITGDTSAAADAIRKASRPLLVLGPLPVSAAHDGTKDAVGALARTIGAPVHAEAASQLRFMGVDAARVDALDLLLRVGSAAREADLLIEIGAPPTSMSLDRHVSAHPALARVRLEARWARDPHATSEAIVVGDLPVTLRDLAARLAQAASPDAAWASRIEAADRIAQAIAEREAAPFGELAVARALAEGLPRGAWLSVGNSLPIRALDRAAPSRPSGITVLHQRGVNGIDGLVSGAAGASLASPTPHALLLGDLSFQHDVGGLAVARAVRAPLAVVVVNNGGGRIFEQLPLGRDRRFESIMPSVLTPQRFDVEHAARAFGVRFRRAEAMREFRGALTDALETPRATVIEAMVGPSSYREDEDRILAALAAALEEAVG